MSLELKGVSLILGGRQLIQSLDMQLEPGEVVGLLGPNGAGKTTTFNLIIGQLQPDQGDVVLDGCPITTLTMPQRARMGLGYLPQEASVFRSLTVGENLLLSLEQSRLPAPERRQRLNELVADFRLEPFLQRRGAQLSGGERRRTEVARALAVGPSWRPVLPRPWPMIRWSSSTTWAKASPFDGFPIPSGSSTEPPGSLALWRVGGSVAVRGRHLQRAAGNR